MEEERSNDRHGWKRAGPKSVIRIDHSDVYFENEKLGEDLESKMANIHRNRYRQFLNRDSEIAQLKKSLEKMRQGSANSSILNRAPIGRRRPRPNVPPETLSVHPTPETYSSTPKTRAKKTSFEQQQEERGPFSHSTPRPPRIRNISIKMPHADKNVSDSSDSSDDDDDDDDDDDLDGVFDLNSVGSSDDGGGGGDGYLATNKNQNRFRPFSSAVSKQVNKEKEIRSKSCTFQDMYRANARRFSLETLMKMLKLDQIPTSWYTSVVPASDVTFKRRPGKSILYELTNKGNNPHVRSWEPPRPQQRSSLAKSGSPLAEKQRQNRRVNDNFPLRPHTSLGMSKAVPLDKNNDNNNINDNINNNQGTSSLSRSNTPKAGSRLSRPVTASSQKSPLSSSKTVRQLKEMAEQDELDILSSKPSKGVQWMLNETKEQRKVIDYKVNTFLRSLEELKKAKRLKEQALCLQSKKSTVGFADLSSFSPASVHFQSNGLVDSTHWKADGVTSRVNVGIISDVLDSLPSARPATVS